MRFLAQLFIVAALLLTLTAISYSEVCFNSSWNTTTILLANISSGTSAVGSVVDYNVTYNATTMTSNFSNLKFVSLANVSLPYVIEDYVNNSWALARVRIDQAFDQNGFNIKMCTWNTTLVPDQRGTMDLIGFSASSDFNNGTTFDYPWHCLSGTCTQSAGNMSLSSSGILLSASDTLSGRSCVIIESRTRPTNSNGYGQRMEYKTNSAGSNSVGYESIGAYAFSAIGPTMGADGGQSTGTFQSTVNQWYRVTVVFNMTSAGTYPLGHTVCQYNETSFGRAGLDGCTTVTTNSTSTNNYIALLASDGSDQHDWMLLRPCNVFEPTLALGSNTTSIAPTISSISLTPNPVLITGSMNGTISSNSTSTSTVLHYLNWSRNGIVQSAYNQIINASGNGTIVVNLTLNLSIAAVGDNWSITDIVSDLSQNSTASTSNNVTVYSQNLTDCFNITNTGNYNLTGNIDVTGENMGCFNITANNSQLDCRGFPINGPQKGRAIYINATNVTTKNCVISSFGQGIVANGSLNVTIQNNSFLNLVGLRGADAFAANSTYPIYLVNTNFSLVQNNTATNTTGGMAGNSGINGGYAVMVELSSSHNNNISQIIGWILTGGNSSVGSGNAPGAPGSEAYGIEFVNSNNNIAHSLVFAYLTSGDGTSGGNGGVAGNGLNGGTTAAIKTTSGKNNIIYDVLSSNQTAGRAGIRGALGLSDGYGGNALCILNTDNSSVFYNVTCSNLTFGNNRGGTGINGTTYGIANSYATRNNSAYLNNFTAAVWVNDSGINNTYNISAVGNIYYYQNGTGIWAIYNITNDGLSPWAVYGSALPISNATNNTAWIGNGSDWHPYTTNFTAFASFVALSVYSNDYSGYFINETLNATACAVGGQNLTNMNLTLLINSSFVNGTLLNITAGTCQSWVSNYTASRGAADANLSHNLASNNTNGHNNVTVLNILPIDPVDAMVLKGGNGTPDLNCTLQPGVSAIIFSPHFTYNSSTHKFNNASNLVYPVNQSYPAGIYLCKNNGTAAGWLQIQLNDTYPNVLTVVSTDYFSAVKVLANGTPKNLTLLPVNSSANVSEYRNYSTNTFKNVGDILNISK